MCTPTRGPGQTASLLAVLKLNITPIGSLHTQILIMVPMERSTHHIYNQTQRRGFGHRCIHDGCTWDVQDHFADCKGGDTWLKHVPTSSDRVMQHRPSAALRLLSTTVGEWETGFPSLFPTQRDIGGMTKLGTTEFGANQGLDACGSIVEMLETCYLVDDDQRRPFD